MNSAVMLFFGLIAIFVFTIVSFIKKNQQLRQSQIAREQAFLSAMVRNKKGSSPS
ncbi:hypothetical protein [Candidatus Albibeggiatoa sp. nov. BB20]|uniref:hypothetical protein n=1 Tax=Candidatus Albibeggiatoa sp. nov. BB20 TaxID=3162723 RepID=UPI003365A2BC